MKKSIKKLSIFWSMVASVLIISMALTACSNNNEQNAIKPVAKLIIAQQPIKTAYIQGERFDSTGLIVNAEFEDGTSQDNVKYAIIPDRPLQPTDTEVAATYGNKKVGIKITVAVRGNQSQYSVNNTPPIAGSPLEGRTYLFLGSSVTLGSASGEESMADYIAKRNTCTAIKKASSGTTLADLNNKSYISRLEKYIDSEEKAITLNAFICQLSTNDANKPESFGTITATDIKEKNAFDKTTTFGAIEYIIATVKETWNCPIVFYTNGYYENAHYAEMVTGLKQIETKWGIVVLDLYNDTQFNNISADERELYMRDEIHPTKAGYRDWWTPKFEEVLDSVSTWSADV